VALGTSECPRTIERARGELFKRLCARRPEIEEAIAARVYAISDPREVADATYLQGLRAALAAAIDYALAAVELGERRAPDPPPLLLAQARMAARNGIELETVLRRYFAGYAILTEFMIGEGEAADLIAEAGLRRVLKGQGTLFDRLLEGVSEEHAREVAARLSTKQRRAERVRRLLAGELIDTSELEYDLEGHHLGLVGLGRGVAETIRALARRIDKRLLLVDADERTVWAWLGSRGGFEADDLQAVCSASLPADCLIAFGEPAAKTSGWRLTHRQACAALFLAGRRENRTVRYRDVAVLASLLQDELLIASLRELYINPLQADRDGGKSAFETLGAYFDTGRQIASTAATLGLNRNTVANRLRTIESTIGLPIDLCATELEASLKVLTYQ
jgi:hypothetical protein